MIGNQRRCGCGGIGCIETLASRRAILDAARQERFADSLEELAARLQDGPLPAWLRAALDAAAMGIAASLNTLGVRTVILTGYMSDLPPVATEYLRAAISTDTMWARSNAGRRRDDGWSDLDQSQWSERCSRCLMMQRTCDER